MDPNVNEWIKLILRWVHVFAGIMWVGTTYFFTWLDGRFVELEKQAKAGGNPEKNVWMVHSGGFYRVEKQKVPNVMPEKLHWFRWEAALTWLSGILLFLLVYYHGRLMVSLDEDVARLSHAAAVWLSVGLLAVSVPFYDLIMVRVLKNEIIGVIVSFVVVMALSWFLMRYLMGRAAYLQLGAMFGTIMVANVWMRILPAQRRMVAALKTGQEPNQTEALRAKNCSKHNTFLAVPVVFLMISNHFPTITYGNQHYGWLILSGLVLAGWGAAKLIRRA
jgi:uncharacterized membrane protein